MEVVNRMHSIFENIMIMILTILILVGGAYLVLLMLEWGLKIKSGNREQEGLTSMWASTYKQSTSGQNLPKDTPTISDSTSDDESP
jgi:hypothetical protein